MWGGLMRNFRVKVLGIVRTGTIQRVLSIEAKDEKEARAKAIMEMVAEDDSFKLVKATVNELTINLTLKY